MKHPPAQIIRQIRAINAQISTLGPVLIGTIKRSKCRKTRKDGSRYVSGSDYYTFVYRDGDGRERWKRFGAALLPDIREMKGNGDAYKKLARQHARLTALLGLARLGEKKCPGPAGAPVPEHPRRP